MTFWSNPKSPKAPRDRTYLGYVKQLPCAVCHKFGLPDTSSIRDAHHTICGRYSQAKTPDFDAIPLCQFHHQALWGPQGTKVAIHKDKAEWERRYGPDTGFIEWTRKRIEEQFGYEPKESE